MSSSKRTMLQQVFQVQFEFRQREKNEIVNFSTPYKMESILGVGSISSSVHDQSADRTQSAGRARCTFDETLVIEDFEMTFYDIELDLRLSV